MEQGRALGVVLDKDYNSVSFCYVEGFSGMMYIKSILSDGGVSRKVSTGDREMVSDESFIKSIRLHGRAREKFEGVIVNG